jgi:hypothetical protein
MKSVGITHDRWTAHAFRTFSRPITSANEFVIEVRAAGVGNWDDVACSAGLSIGPTIPYGVGVGGYVSTSASALVLRLSCVAGSVRHCRRGAQASAAG